MSPLSDPLIEAARRIRPHLRKLVGEALALDIDARLGELLSVEEITPEVVEAVRATLTEDDRTRAFVTHEVVKLGAPADRSAGLIPSGDPEPVPMPVFRCPLGDFVFERIDVGEPLPVCPTHELLVVPD